MAIGVRGANASAQNWLDGGKVQGWLSPEGSFLVSVWLSFWTGRCSFITTTFRSGCFRSISLSILLIDSHFNAVPPAPQSYQQPQHCQRHEGTAKVVQGG